MFVISKNGHTINNGRCLQKKATFVYFTQKHRDDEAVVWTAEKQEAASRKINKQKEKNTIQEQLIKTSPVEYTKIFYTHANDAPHFIIIIIIILIPSSVTFFYNLICATFLVFLYTILHDFLLFKIEPFRTLFIHN